MLSGARSFEESGVGGRTPAVRPRPACCPALAAEQGSWEPFRCLCAVGGSWLQKLTLIFSSLCSGLLIIIHAVGPAFTGVALLSWSTRFLVIFLFGQAERLQSGHQDLSPPRRIEHFSARLFWHVLGACGAHGLSHRPLPTARLSARAPSHFAAFLALKPPDCRFSGESSGSRRRGAVGSSPTVAPGVLTMRERQGGGDSNPLSPPCPSPL